MRTLLIIHIFLFTSLSLTAQNWLTDYDEAIKTASEQNRNIILVFQGSDWCAPCIKLEREIWNNKEFKKYAKDHFVLLKADFPRKKKNNLSKEQQDKNNMLAEKYNKNGFFPLVLVLDQKGRVLGETGYRKVSVNEYIEILNSY